MDPVRSTAPTSPPRTLRRKLRATLAVVGLLATCGAFGTYSAYTATTSNTSNTINNGSVKIDQHSGATSLYNVSNQGSASTTTGCVRVTYSGSLPAAVRLYSSAAISNGSAFNVTIERGSGLTSPNSSMSCSGFTADSTVYTGTLAGLPSAWSGGGAGKLGETAWATGDAVDYRFTVSPVDDGTLNAHVSAQASSAHSFTWEARNYGPYADAVLQTPGLRSYYRLGEASGSSIFDTAPTNPANGSYVGSPSLGQPSLLATDSDTSATFNGTTQRADIADTADLHFTTALSVEAWVSTQDLANYRYVLGKETTAQLRVSSDGKLNFFTYNGTSYGGGAPAPTAMVPGQTYHVVGTYDGSFVRLYVNGSLVSQTARTGSMVPTSDPLYIGVQNGVVSYWKGGIDDVSLYDRALTAAEVKRHYQLGSGT